MELPDFMKYANKFSQSDFVEKIANIAKRAGASADSLLYTAERQGECSQQGNDYRCAGLHD